MTSNGNFDENAIAKAVDAALPVENEDSIRAAISGLMPNDRTGASAVIERIAAIRLPPMVVDGLMQDIKDKTLLKAKVLEQTLSYAQRAGGKGGDGGRGGGGDDEESVATAIVNLAISMATSEFFHTATGDGYATIEINDHKETWSLKSKVFRRWLTKIFYDKTGSVPNSESLGAAINVLEAMAGFDGLEIPVFLRVGEHDGKVYLDLCDSDWRVIEIDADGWRIASDPAIKFRRTGGMLPLPVPQQGGNIDSLRELLNVRDENSFVMAVGFLIGALNPHGPYAVMGLGGDHGAAKTSFAKTIRDLVDPQSLPPRGVPLDDRDLFIAANNGWILAYDNLSGLPVWLSDSFCRLSTGGGFATRQLYSDGDEILFEAMRPVILNGRNEFITRADLADRSLMLGLMRIESPLTQSELRARFKAAHPVILGALLDAVSHGLKHLHDTKPDKLPRMSDFALWVTASEGAIWDSGTFIKAYKENRAAATETVLDADLVAIAVRKLMASRKGTTHPWKGTATELLEKLSPLMTEGERREKEWPKAANALSRRLKDAAVGLRDVCIDVQFLEEGHEKTKNIIIAAVSAVSAVSAGAAGAERGDAGHPESMKNGIPPAGKPWERYVSGDAADAADEFPSVGKLESRPANGGEGGEAGARQGVKGMGELPTASPASPMHPEIALSEWAVRFLRDGLFRIGGILDLNPDAPTPPWLVIRQTPAKE